MLKNVLIYKCGPDEYGPKVIENSLESFQKEVNGPIEYSFIHSSDEKNFYFVVNEEGQLRNMPLNFITVDGLAFAGPVFVVAYKIDEDGNEVETNLDVEDIDWLEDWFLKNVEDEDLINEGI